MILYRQKLFNAFEKKVISTITDFNKKGVRDFIKGKGYKNLTNRDSVRMKDAIVAISDFIERKRDLSPKQLKSMSTLLKNAGVTNTEEEAAKQLQILQRKYKNKDAIIRFAKKAERKGGGIKKSEEEINKMLAERDKLEENKKKAAILSIKSDKDLDDMSYIPSVIKSNVKIAETAGKRGVAIETDRESRGAVFMSNNRLNKTARENENLIKLLTTEKIPEERRAAIFNKFKSNPEHKNLRGRNGTVVLDADTISPAEIAHEFGHARNYINFTPKQRRTMGYRFNRRKNWEGPEKWSRGLKNIAKDRLKGLDTLREELQASARGYRDIEKALAGDSKKDQILNKVSKGLTSSYDTYSTGVGQKFINDTLYNTKKLK